MDYFGNRACARLGDFGRFAVHAEAGAIVKYARDWPELSSGVFDAALARALAAIPEDVLKEHDAEDDATLYPTFLVRFRATGLVFLLAVSPFFEADKRVAALITPPRRRTLFKFLQKLRVYACRNPLDYRSFSINKKWFFDVFIEHGLLYESVFDWIDVDG